MGKTAVVTGGGSGIGRVTALKLAAGGADIVIIHMDPEEKAAEVVKEIEALGVKAKAIRMNVADFAAVKNALDDAKIECESAEVTWIPENYIEASEEVGAKVTKLIDALDAIDDVQNIYTNYDMKE